MTPEALVDEHVYKRIDARVEGDNDDTNDVGDVSVFLACMEVIQHVDNQHWKPSNAVHSAYLQPKKIPCIERLSIDCRK